MKIKGFIFIFCFSLFAEETPSKKTENVFEFFNAATMSLKWHDYEAEIENIEYENRDDLGSLGLSIRGVQHPEAYKDWSWNFRVSPSIHLDRMKLRPARTEKEADPTRPDINAKRFSILANLRLNYHLPIGQFQASVGYGPAFYRIDFRDDRDTAYPIDDLTKFELVYLAFPYWERLFFMAGPRVYIDDGVHVVWALRLGWFWGDSSHPKKKFDILERLNLK